MKAKSIKGNSTKEIKKELIQSRADGFKPSLALVFVSIKLDILSISEMFNTEGIQIIGATSSGLFINGFQDGYESKGSAAIMLFEMPSNSYKLVFEDLGDRNLEGVVDKLSSDALDYFEDPAIILLSTYQSKNGNFFDGAHLIKILENKLGKETKIFGGMAGDDFTLTGTFVFNNSQISDYGIAALVLDENIISLEGMATSGWKPLGIEKTVTKCDGSWIYTIDDKPALELYLKYLGKESISDVTESQMLEEIGIFYPFQAAGIGDPIMRTPMGIDINEGALKMDFPVPQGAKLKFSMPPDFDIVESILEDANELKKLEISDADALLIFSCVGRLSALGPLATNENEGLSEVWNAPMAGFFSYGEYGTVKNKRQGFHSTTCSWVALKEK